ncbi:MAG: [Fe-S]-binding protein, partial [Gammaproteobacteria bacterium]|nr:[Fe-S]-binding protein [Gammaproteobacteria bacterium]
MTFAGWEKALLGILLLVSVALTLREVLPKFRFMLAGKSDRNRTDQPGRRIARVVSEVLLQSKVIQGRPVVGTLHALVFFGFLVFAFETIDHFLEPFGVPFLTLLLGGAEPAVKIVIAVIAVLVIFSIAGLFIRRFFMVKISPDPRSWSSGLVAIMIFLLMATYLYGLGEVIQLPKANWWAHAALILAFPP